MAKYFVIYFFICLAGWNAVLAEEPQFNEEYSDSNRNARHLHKRKQCQYCGGGFGGYQGGYFPGNQYPYPPINIGISQSQSSASGGYGGGYNPYYNQYNSQYNNQYNSQYNRPYNNQYNNQYNGYSGHQSNGFGPYNRPFYGNGYDPQNNQYNGNYILANTGNGYGFTRFGNEYDEQYDGDEDNARSASKKD